MTAPVSILKSVDTPRSVTHKLQCTVIDGRESGSSSGQSPKCLKLRVERRSEGHIIQLSQEKDLRFLYRDLITPAKFEELAAKWNLRNVDMEDFFQDHLAEFLKNDTSKCYISSRGETCKLEFERCSEIFTIHINFELEQVAGDDLLQHTIDTVHSLAKRLQHSEAHVSRLRTLEKEHKQIKERETDLERELEAATSKVESLENQLESVDRKRLEAENDFQLAVDEKEDLENELDDLANKHEDMKRDLVQAIDDYDAIKIENDDLKRQLQYAQQGVDDENTNLKRKAQQLQSELAKYDHIIQKYGYGQQQPPVSVSDQKLTELEEASKEKDFVIEGLQKHIAELTKANGDLSEEKMKVAEALKKTIAINRDLDARAKSIERHNAVLQSMVKQPSLATRRQGFLPQGMGSPLHTLNGLYNAQSPQMDPLSRMNILKNTPPLGGGLAANRFPQPTRVATPELNRYLAPRASSPSLRPSPFQPAVPSSVAALPTTPSFVEQLQRERENTAPRH